MSILEYNGAAMIAMAGKDCVGIAADRRLGLQQQTVATDFIKVFPMSSNIFVGLAGLATDVQTLNNLLKFRMSLYSLREEREMSPQVFSHLLSTLLYEKRFGPWFCEPIGMYELADCLMMTCCCCAYHPLSLLTFLFSLPLSFYSCRIGQGYRKAISLWK
jgi:20S proteasome alpha/beta subunit